MILDPIHGDESTYTYSWSCVLFFLQRPLGSPTKFTYSQSVLLHKQPHLVKRGQRNYYGPPSEVLLAALNVVLGKRWGHKTGKEKTIKFAELWYLSVLAAKYAWNTMSSLKSWNQPMYPEPDVSLFSCRLSSVRRISFSHRFTYSFLLSLQKLRTIVGHLRPISAILSVRANNSKCLQLSLNTECVKVETD